MRPRFRDGDSKIKAFRHSRASGKFIGCQSVTCVEIDFFRGQGAIVVGRNPCRAAQGGGDPVGGGLAGRRWRKVIEAKAPTHEPSAAKPT